MVLRIVTAHTEPAQWAESLSTTVHAEPVAGRIRGAWCLGTQEHDDGGFEDRTTRVVPHMVSMVTITGKCNMHMYTGVSSWDQLSCHLAGGCFVQINDMRKTAQVNLGVALWVGIVRGMACKAKILYLNVIKGK